MANSSLIAEEGRTQATPTLYNNLVKDALRLLSMSGGTKNIVSGSITVFPGGGVSHYFVDTEGGVSNDELDYVVDNGDPDEALADGDIIALQAVSPSRIITVKHGTGNFVLHNNIPIQLDATQSLLFRYDGTNWYPYGGGNQTASMLFNKSEFDVSAGDVVVFDTTNDNAFALTTYKKDIRVMGVAKSAILDNSIGPITTIAGEKVTVNCDTAPVERGQFLITSTTSGKATAGSYYRELGVFAIALTSKSGGSTGTVEAMLVDNFRQGIIGTSGWQVGGEGYTNNADKFTMAVETWTIVSSAALPQSIYQNNGMGSTTIAGYSAHGFNGAYRNYRNKIPFATETASALTNSTVLLANFRSGTNFSSKGFSPGGYPGGSPVNTTKKTTFSTDTESSGNTLSSGRRGQVGLSDGTYCYVGASFDNVYTDKLDNATETFSYWASANVVNSSMGYAGFSFPSSAGYRAASATISRKLVYSTGVDTANSSNPTFNMNGGAAITDGISFGYFSTSTGSTKLSSSTDIYSSLSNYASTQWGACFNYAAY